LAAFTNLSYFKDLVFDIFLDFQIFTNLFLAETGNIKGLRAKNLQNRDSISTLFGRIISVRQTRPWLARRGVRKSLARPSSLVDLARRNDRPSGFNNRALPL
jgi:hypothetical protein